MELSLEYINLSNNVLTNKHIEDLATCIKNCTKSKLNRLDLSNNKLTVKGLLSLLQGLKHNNGVKLTHLWFDRADLEIGNTLDQIATYKLLLKTINNFMKINKNLQVLSLSSCSISNELMNSICQGLSMNDKLHTLILKNNNIDTEGLTEIIRTCSIN